MNATIDVRDLRIGMYVHLDLGWMSHPFPLSSFRIADAGQIETIRRLGIARVRWSPAHSDAPTAAAEPVRRHAYASAHACATPAVDDALAAQRAALLACQRGYAEAARDWHRIHDGVAVDPKAAGSAAGALTRALLDKMLGERALCIRVLSDGAGDHADEHPLNVAIVALLMGRAFGLSEVELHDLGVGALMHDVGKLDLAPGLRHIDDGFTAEEAAAYRDHVAHGVAWGRRMALTPGALLVIAQHHEHADGSGFPLKLPSERMSAAARIVALVNRYDNLVNPPLAARAMTPHEALSLLFANGQQTFDVTMLNAFIRLMGVYPAGSVVQLTDDRYAMVMSANSSRPLKPRVLIHDPRTPRDAAVHVDLGSQPALGIRRSVRPAQLPGSVRDWLQPAPRVRWFFEPAPVPADAATA